MARPRALVLGALALPVVLQRGAAAFSPSDLSGLVLWLKADAGLFQDVAKTTPAGAGDPVGCAADQSGGGFDATQAVALSRPARDDTVLTAGPVLSFNSDILTFPYPLGAETDFTVFVLFQENNLAWWDFWNFANGEAAWGNAWSIASGSDGNIYVNTDGTANGITTAYPPEILAGHWYMIGFRKDGAAAGNLTLRKNALQLGTNGANTAGDPVSDSLDMMASSSIGYVAEEIVYNRALTDAECLQVEAYLKRWFQQQVIFDGDSLTAGTGSTGGLTYPEQVFQLYGQDFFFYNLGVAGQTIVQMETDAAAQVDPLLSDRVGLNAVCVFGGTNDIVAGADAATVYNNIVTYCQSRQAAGWKVVVLTILPRAAADPFEARRQTVNANIVANWATFADALADVGGDPDIGDAGDNTDLTYYDADQVHMNNTGYGVVAAIVKAALDTL